MFALVAELQLVKRMKALTIDYSRMLRIQVFHIYLASSAF